MPELKQIKSTINQTSSAFQRINLIPAMNAGDNNDTLLFCAVECISHHYFIVTLSRYTWNVYRLDQIDEHNANRNVAHSIFPVKVRIFTCHSAQIIVKFDCMCLIDRNSYQLAEKRI